MPNPLFLQELKRLILIKANIKVISPSDCRIISSSVQKELKKNISETTIKRLFGFAEIKHEFSKFTINTLMEYVGMANEQTIGKKAPSIEQVPEDAFEQLRARAQRITYFTLQNIKNRCSVPYEMTIARKFARHDLMFFHSSKYSFTSFISQPGYGKSILLSHLVQQMFIDDDAPFKKDIVLFLNADYLFNKELEELSLEERIKSRIGLHQHTDLIAYFNDQWLTHGHKFIIILDGFSELVINKTTKQKVFDSIISLVNNIEQQESIKLILGMRSTTWNRFYDKMRYSYFLKSKWFPGNYFNLNDSSNVPPLTEIEVEQIFQKMSPLDFAKISDSLKAQLKFPFQIQWYYQLKEEYPAFDSYTNIIHYEIIARFIQEKIYNSTYATEKVLFCKKIIHLTNYGRRGYSVTKTDLIKEMPVFKNAYMELLTDGILMEEKHVKSGFPSEFVRFIQPHVFEYFLFTELYELFNQQMDERFFELVHQEYVGNHVRFQLLQWSVRLLVRLNKFKEINAVLNLKLNNYEKNYLIYFIAENLNYRNKKDPNLLNEIREQQLHKLLMKQFIHFDFIDSYYKDAVKCLIEVADSPEIELYYHAILSIFDCLSLNQSKILKRLEKMEDLKCEAKNWDINPYEAIKLIYLRIKDVAITQNYTLQKIEDFKYGSKINGAKEKELPDMKQVISYLLVFMVNLFYGSPLEATKIISAIVREHPKLMKTRKFFSIYLLNLMAQACARTNPSKKTDQMEKILTQLYADETRVNPTLYAQSVFLSLKAEQSKNRKDYAAALQYAHECIKIYKRNDLAINELFTYNLIIGIYKELKDYEKVEEYSYHKLNLLDSKQVNVPVFKSTSFI